MLVLATALAGFACSSSSSPAQGNDAGPACDPTKCYPNNECLDDGMTGVKCRLVCSSQYLYELDSTKSGCPSGETCCPANYTCTSNPAAAKPFCVQNTATIMPGKGQWGQSCKATGGLANNPDCDSAQGFQCYGRSTTDAQAYCTQFNCQQDTDCAGGWQCATANAGPDVTTTDRRWGKTIKVCIPRSYCAACTADVDCPQLPQPDGRTQYCVADGSGFNYCAPTCATSSCTTKDERCVVYPNVGAQQVPMNLCYPRSTVCKGDGHMCSGCFSDADCVNGFCTLSTYSHERYCTEKSGIACTVDSMMRLHAMCPSSLKVDVGVSCVVAGSGDSTAPQDQCFGLVNKSDGSGGFFPIPGCWSVNECARNSDCPSGAPNCVAVDPLTMIGYCKP